MSNANLSITTLLFDWDGTVVDSAHLGRAAFRKAFASLGVTFAEEVYEASYSPNWYVVYEALGLPKEKWPLADDLWRLHYNEEIARPIEGATETLLELHRQGYRLGVVTSGNESRVCREIEQAALVDVFQTLICNEQIVKHKPDPEGLEIAMQRLNSSREQTAYVGDTPEDIQMGKGANVLTVGIKSSYPSSSRLISSEPDIYLESITELPNHFRSLRAANSE